MSADSDAFEVVKQLPDLTAAEQQYLLAVARGEGFYGLGWGSPSPGTIQLSKDFGIDPRAGVGSNNWGAEQKQGSAGSFPHVDHDSQGKPYVEQYKRHKTPLEGAASVARILLKPNLRAALSSGFYVGPPPLRDKPTANQRKFHASKLSVAGTIIGPLKAAVFTQHDNRYFELDPELYFKGVKTNYDKLTANLKWEPLLIEKPLPEAGFLRGQEFSVPGVQDDPNGKK